jgi:hypothetical protein
MKKLKKALYLDDVRTPTETLPNYKPWYVVRNYDEFVKWIDENGIPDLISFDHDLADEHISDYAIQVASQGYQHPNYEEYKEKTGVDCAKYVIDYCQTNDVILNKCVVHSHNPVGGKNIQDGINGFKNHMGWDQDCYIGKFPFKVETKTK